MERSVIYSNLPSRDNLCRCKQLGLGLYMEQPDNAWILDAQRSSLINQLARAQGSLVSNAVFSNTEGHHDSDSYRQSNQSSLHQQARGNAFFASAKFSNRHLELVPPTQHRHSGSTHSRHSEYDCRLRISSSIPEEPVANSSLGVYTDKPNLGSIRRRSFCESNDLPPTKIRVMASGSGAMACRRIYSQLADPGQSIYQSPLESDISGPYQATSRPSLSSGHSSPVLDKCAVVSPPLLHGQSTIFIPPPLSGSIDNGTQYPPSPQESALETIRLESIRSKFLNQGLSDPAIHSLMSKYDTSSPSFKNYRKY
ncbi:hypothetical protein BDF20DRAFT_581721 [Mycotypha africana]|uniref:uncharacterized protein n=1 Tax=Mycotypha africana TaxID=64632 RepID=UPI0023018AC5|nr:uncharacterized protein BDF20DRAFT_581721 [Mycotypha africana]KAI8977693.1 hypothetical protein BDF20DRAFT_581721 [Mycotypha africana]